MVALNTTSSWQPSNSQIINCTSENIYGLLVGGSIVIRQTVLQGSIASITIALSAISAQENAGDCATLDLVSLITYFVHVYTYTHDDQRECVFTVP